MNKKIFINSNNFVLYNDDCFKRLKKLEPKSVDMIFADPPYFLSSGGVSCRSGKQVSVNKADWDKSIPIQEKIRFNRKWIQLCKEVLKDNGTIWISGTFHNIYAIGIALELEGFSIINNITWQKPNPTPNLACRCFTNSTETILWARKQLTPIKKGKHTFNYSLMKEINGGKQMKDVWLIPFVTKEEKKYGKHPTQKPLALLNGAGCPHKSHCPFALSFTAAAITGSLLNTVVLTRDLPGLPPLLYASFNKASLFTPLLSSTSSSNS